MSFIRLSLLSLAACLVWTGCPPADRKVDEEKDSWYIMGETRQSSMDYEGAVEQFLKALEVNPHSASAHKKLGILYEKEIEVPDYAAAIYHYQRLLALRPDDLHADIIRDSIGACRQELAAEVGLVPARSAYGRDPVRARRPGEGRDETEGRKSTASRRLGQARQRRPPRQAASDRRQ